MIEAERDARAFALMQSAHQLIAQGEWEQAAVALEEAAALHRAAGRPYDEARCLQLAATLRRSAGDPQRARLLAERAAAVAPADQPLAVSIAAEQAETAFAEGRHQDSVAAWTRAIELARQAAEKPGGLSAMLRRRAAAYLAMRQIEPASRDFDEAYRLLPKELAGFVRAEQAGLLAQYGYVQEAEHALEGIEADSNPHLRAEMLVMRARLARAGGRTDEALVHAGRARDDALQAVAPLSYFAASVEMAEAFEARGDRTNAYGTLATAWATLGDLLGEDVAGSWIEPILLAYQLKWSEEAFLQAKRQYEASRRSEIDARPNA